MNEPIKKEEEEFMQQVECWETEKHLKKCEKCKQKYET